MADDIKRSIVGNDIKNGTKISWVAKSGTAKIGTDGVQDDNEHVNTRDTVTNTNRLDDRFEDILVVI